MLRSVTWRKERRRNGSLSLTWICVVAAVAGMLKAERISPIHSTAQECPSKSGTTVECYLMAGKLYKLGEFIWPDAYTKFVLEANTARLILEEPMCNENTPVKREVVINNASKVTTIKSENTCPIQLVLNDCKEITVEYGVNLVRMKQSEANKVVLPRLSQFDLIDSHVKEVFFSIDADKSTIKGSQIDVVHQMVIQGSFTFIIKDSTLSHVHTFVYNSTKSAYLTNVIFGSVSSNGFHVIQAGLTLTNCTIKQVESKGIRVARDSLLTIQDGDLVHTSEDSIVVDPKGTVIFESGTIGEFTNVSFKLSGGSLKLYPLSFLSGSSSMLIVGPVIAFFSGLVVGIAAGAVAMFCVRRQHLRLKTVGETAGLLTLGKSTTQTESNNKQMVIPSPRPIDRPLPSLPNSITAEEDLYEQYSDVVPNVPAPNIPPALATGGSSTTGLPPGIKNRPKLQDPPDLPRRNECMRSTSQDDRNALPPPPPPIEEDEVYDQLESLRGPPPKPISSRLKFPAKSKPPPPPIRSKPRKT